MCESLEGDLDSETHVSLAAVRGFATVTLQESESGISDRVGPAGVVEDTRHGGGRSGRAFGLRIANGSHTP